MTVRVHRTLLVADLAELLQVRAGRPEHRQGGGIRVQAGPDEVPLPALLPLPAGPLLPEMMNGTGPNATQAEVKFPF